MERGSERADGLTAHARESDLRGLGWRSRQEHCLLLGGAEIRSGSGGHVSNHTFSLDRLNDNGSQSQESMEVAREGKPTNRCVSHREEDGEGRVLMPQLWMEQHNGVGGMHERSSRFRQRMRSHLWVCRV